MPTTGNPRFSDLPTALKYAATTLEGGGGGGFSGPEFKGSEKRTERENLLLQPPWNQNPNVDVNFMKDGAQISLSFRFAGSVRKLSMRLDL